jgi:hypothetical protein
LQFASKVGMLEMMNFLKQAQQVIAADAGTACECVGAFTFCSRTLMFDRWRTRRRCLDEFA